MDERCILLSDFSLDRLNVLEGEQSFLKQKHARIIPRIWVYIKNVQNVSYFI